jgi:putative flippase GtrA
MSAALHSIMTDPTPPAGRSSSGLRQLLAFCAIGAGGAAGFVVVSTLALSLWPSVDPWLINALCYGGFIVPIYLLQRRFAFRSALDHAVALPRYIGVQLLALCLAAIFGQVVHGVLGLPTLFGSLLVIGLTSGVNFAVLRGWAFATPTRLVRARV